MAFALEIGLGKEPTFKIFKTVKKFDDLYKGNAEIGDLFLVRRKGYVHAGVCCSEDEEIIHFTSQCPQGTFASVSTISQFSSSSSSCLGLVSKVHMKDFFGNDTFAIYRKIEGIPASFKDNVRKAMQTDHQYSLLLFNCIHFAMELLGVQTEKGEVKFLMKLLGLL